MNGKVDALLEKELIASLEDLSDTEIGSKEYIEKSKVFKDLYSSYNLSLKDEHSCQSRDDELRFEIDAKIEEYKSKKEITKLETISKITTTACKTLGAVLLTAMMFSFEKDGIFANKTSNIINGSIFKKLW